MFSQFIRIFFAVIKLEVVAFVNAKNFFVTYPDAPFNVIYERRQPDLRKLKINIGNFFRKHPLISIIKIFCFLYSVHIYDFFNILTNPLSASTSISSPSFRTWVIENVKKVINMDTVKKAKY